MQIDRIINYLHIAMKSIIGFIDDLFDRSKTRKKKGVQVPNILATSLVILSTVSSFLDTIQKVVIQFLGMPVNFLLLFVSVPGFAWCIHVIRGKEKKSNKSSLPGRNMTSERYKYGQAARTMGKLGLILIPLLMPRAISNFIEEITPLPDTVYGYVYDAKTGEPIMGARVRVVNEYGVDVTKDTLPTDSEGRFIIMTLQPINRAAKLIVNRAGCAEKTLLLRREDQYPASAQPRIPEKEQQPAFRYVINCE